MAGSPEFVLHPCCVAMEEVGSDASARMRGMKRSQDRSLELDSRYGCTVPTPEADDDFVRFAECGLRYTLSTDDSLLTIASVRVGESV